MTFLGVPVFEWAALAFALALGVEAWISCRPGPEESEAGKPLEGQDGDRPPG